MTNAATINDAAINAALTTVKIRPYKSKHTI